MSLVWASSRQGRLGIGAAFAIKRKGVLASAVDRSDLAATTLLSATMALVSSGPRFIRFFWPLVSALRELGGESKPREVVELVAERLSVGDDERAERTKSGSLRVDNQMHWARNYLVWDGLVDGSQRGVWKLTPQGWSIPLDEQSHETELELFRRVRSERAGEWAEAHVAESADSEDPPIPIVEEEREELRLEDSLRQAVFSLSPAGFEGLCKRLLSVLGLSQLRGVGQAGDRGIDIEGLLRVNAVVSFRVGVQCKRYADANQVVPRLIREFQGALGPFDRGIFITTGVFTHQASEQATAAGYKPIDLIDGERLVELH